MFSNGVEKIDTKRNSLINPNVARTNVSQNSKNVNERFSKAADTARENITEQTEVQDGERLDVEKYSIEYTDKNKPVVVITDNILKGVPKKETEEKMDYLLELVGLAENADKKMYQRKAAMKGGNVR